MATEPGLPRGGPLGPGTVIDGWEVLEKLHTGGMAFLWSVRPLEGEGAPQLPPGSDGLRWLMKVPRIKGGEDPATIVGFEVEMMILPMLKGVHVPRFIAKGEIGRAHV